MSGYTLEGVDGNSFAIIAYVTKAMRKEGKVSTQRDEFTKDAMSGDYDTLIQKSLAMLDKLNEGVN